MNQRAMDTNNKSRESQSKMKNIHLYDIVYVLCGISHKMGVLEGIEIQNGKITFTINGKPIKLK